MSDRLWDVIRAAIVALESDCDWSVRADAVRGLREVLGEAPVHRGCAECCDADPGLALYCVRCIDKMGDADLNLSCKSVQKRLATQCGFVPKGSDDV